MSDALDLHRDNPGPFYRPFWGEPRYVVDGDTVWLPVSLDHETGRTRVLRCTVACAMGNLARIVCEARGIERWARLSALLVPPADPRHWNQAR